jgi:hypothetical protein
MLMASLPFWMVKSLSEVAAPLGIGVGPKSTLTSAEAKVAKETKKDKAIAAIKPFFDISASYD